MEVDAPRNELDDPMVPFGFVQCAVIVIAITARYLLDVLLTHHLVDCLWKHIVNNVLHQLHHSLHRRKKSVLFTALLTAYSLCTAHQLAYCARACFAMCIVMEFLWMHAKDRKKRDVWPHVSTLITFTRISSGRSTRRWPSKRMAAASCMLKCTIRVCCLRYVFGFNLFNFFNWLEIKTSLPTTFYWSGMKTAPGFSESTLFAIITKCYDGDTCTADHVFSNDEPVPSIFGKSLLIRLHGIDTPEISRRGAKCELEVCLGKVAQRLLMDFITTSPSAQFQLRQCVRDKYFRLTCDVVNEWGESAVEYMKKTGLVVLYSGGTKVTDWCAMRRSWTHIPEAVRCWE